jgi:hypothetical protein
MAIDPSIKPDIDEEYIEDMIKQANDKDGYGEFSEEDFNLCDLLNKL